jgi:predicted Zn-dependent peptidase
LEFARFSLRHHPACFIDKTHLSFNPGSSDREVAHVRWILRRGENHAAPVVSVQVWVKTGSSAERPQEYGMAHLLEHMLFKGTPERGVGVIAREVEAAGGEINAYTSWDTTVYFVNIASCFMDTAIDILADLVQLPDPRN